MPFRWKEIIEKENTIAKAKANSAIDDKTDPHVLLDISIRNLQDQHDQLEHACAVVIAQYKTAQEKLEADIALERQLNTQGQAAAQAGHEDAARAIAHRLDEVRQRLAIEQPGFDAAKKRADEAKNAFAENGELLRQKMAEAQSLSAEIDQAAMEHNMNEAMKAVTSLTSNTTPSFDQIRDRVHAQHAQEEADSELQGDDPDISAVHEQHLVHEAAADDILSQWGAPAAAKPSLAGMSPADRLNA